MKTAIIRSVDLLEARQYDQIEKLIRDALLVAPGEDLGINYFEDIDERYQRIISEMHGEKFTTCFETLDRDLMGGISRKEVAMIFAPSGVGKSVYLTMVAIANIAKGKNVLYISCEMSEDRVSMRADAMTTFVPISDLISKLPTVKERLETFSQECKGKLVIKEFPAGTPSINDMRAYANQLYNYTGFKPDVVILDYIDEIKCSKTLPNLHQEQQVSTRDFRAWMVMDNYAGYTATQANREGTQVKIIAEGQIGDSYGKIRIVDCLWSLNQNDEENTKGVARLYVVKNRNGKKKYIIFIKIDPYNLRMKEIKESEYEKIMGTRAPKAEILDENNS
jgi:replicative DNA helicase